MKMKVYLIGSLREPYVPVLSNKIRALGIEVFDDWYSAGPRADDHWQEYEKGRDHTYEQALHGHASKHVVQFDQSHLIGCTHAVLLLPSGKSCHFEAGDVNGQGKPVYIYFSKGEPTREERWDHMYGLAFRNGGNVAFSEFQLCEFLRAERDKYAKLSDS